MLLTPLMLPSRCVYEGVCTPAGLVGDTVRLKGGAVWSVPVAGLSFLGLVVGLGGFILRVLISSIRIRIRTRRRKSRATSPHTGAVCAVPAMRCALPSQRSQMETRISAAS